MLDLLIIGAGLTGLFAAYTAARAGLRVRVIAKGMGATHWHAGTIDLLGYLPDVEEPVTNWMHALPALPSSHPYRLLGEETITKALGSFQRLTVAAGLPYERAHANMNLPVASASEEQTPHNLEPDGYVRDATPGQNCQLISPVGAARPVYLAPAAQLAGNLEDEQPLVIVGLEGMPDFYPALIAENLQKQGHRARSATVALSPLTRRSDNSPLQVARMLDQPAAQAQLAKMVVDVVEAGERVGLPAVLGLSAHTRLLTQLHETIVDRGSRTSQSHDGPRAGLAVFEIPTLPPSVPGMRLDTTLRAQLARLGVRVEIGMEVCGVRATNRRIEWIETETGSRPLRHRAHNYMLATGGILGGGIRGDRCGRVEETVFNLPLSAPQTRSQWLRPLFLDRQGHPVFQGGVSVDARFRPLDQAGAPVYDNLWAAGAVLAHTDPIRERSREGIALATGYAAATAVASGL
ncbi:MAG: anaerobic glycerol-3-phosphate dehydrogenase subunit B [Caldilineaceae bacterium]|nr:anaerobic glycerol-3-phosphate dehydrogenase subunit B [Caldilineaceae bacterium]